MIRIRSLALLVILAMVATACGGRLSEEQIRAELSADGVGTGSGANGFADDGFSDDGFGGSAIGGTDGTSGGSSSGGSASRGGTSGGTGGEGGGPVGPGTGSDPGTGDPGTVFSGDNGGATDVGVTDTEITLGNVTTLSGPVPGLFAGALAGIQAAAAYQNSQGGLFGRQFKVLSGDDGFNTAKNRSAHKALKNKVFAFAGSFSLFDFASVGEIKSANVLDIGRALAADRQSLPTHISPVPFEVGWATTGCNFLKKRFPNVDFKKFAMLWGNADAARNNAAWQMSACEAAGFEFVYTREVQATESNFTGDIVEMNRLGVQGVMFVFDVSGIARFFKSLHQQRSQFNPPIKYPSPAAYDSDFIRLTGSDAAEGIIIGQNLSFYLGEDASQVPEIGLFQSWMQRVNPNQKTDIFAAYGWMSGRLLFEAMKKVGPEVTREKVLAELKKIKTWNNFGLSENFNVGDKKAGFCEAYVIVRNGRFERLAPSTGFDCNGKFEPFRP